VLPPQGGWVRGDRRSGRPRRKLTKKVFMNAVAEEPAGKKVRSM
jgi:hypothetical protein